MFDREKLFQVPIRSGGIKTALVRWPTDQEWAERMRKQRIIRRQMGGAMGEAEFPDRERVSLELFNAIRQPEETPAEFDEFEAVLVLERLERFEVTSVEEIDADLFEIRGRAHEGSETVHKLRTPTAREAANYEKRRTSRMDKGRESITRASLEPGGELYDACVREFSGYQDGQRPPIIHKVKVIFALLETLADDEPDPE